MAEPNPSMPFLTDEHGPIEVPAGPLDKGLRDRIERALTTTLPEGKRFGVVTLYDFEGKELDSQLAIRLGNPKKGDFKLVLDTAWDGHLSGFVGVSGSF